MNKSKTNSKKSRVFTSEQPRKIKSPSYKSFRLNKRIKKMHDALPKARELLRSSLLHLWKYRKPFGGIVLIYLFLTVLLVKGLSVTSDVPEIKLILEEALTGVGGRLTTGITIFGYLLGSSAGVTSDVAGTYQSILLVIVSLAVIWALRQTHAGKKVGVRDAFYKGMYPLIPFLGVLLVIGLQCLPLAAASWLFNVTVVSGLAVTAAEQILWSIFCFLLALLTIYMVSSSVFALYISTLPDMTPMKALRSARELVRHRRWEILRKVLFLPTILLIGGAIIIVPVIMLLTPLAEWVFFALSMAVLAVSHSYIYSLYRELL